MKRRSPGTKSRAASTTPTSHRQSNVTDLQLWAYEAAAAHLLAVDLTPAPDVPALRAMWARGGASRRMAEIIAHRWEMAS
jgi:hypothetical protein